MLLAIDAGNTNITIGVFDKGQLVGNFRINTKIPRTSDEYGTMIREIIYQNGIALEKITDAIYASVVPAVNHSLVSGIIKYFDIHPVIVKDNIKTGIKIALDRPEQVGADRIVDAAGAYTLYGGPIIVIDYGTATTYDLVNAKGEFLAGVTAPGIRISAKALWEDAAKLPEIEIKKPASILAKETISSMQAGLVYGQIGQTEYIIEQMIKESGYDDVKVVATGGLGKMISQETDRIDEYNPHLTLIGLNILYELNQDGK